MNNTMIGSSDMDQENHLAHDNSFSNDHWVDMNAYSQMAMPGYGEGFYVAPAHGLPSESIGGHMLPPPIPQQIPNQHHTQYSAQLPPPLIIPTHHGRGVAWPSLQTNPGQSYSAPPVAIPPQSAPLPRQQPKLPSLTTSQPRKTLTDDDRRKMCQFAEDNPTVKQTEIGQRFGVERSTVSKVLRKKEQYLYQEERSGSPIKKIKGKSTDIERALANWARNQQKKGHVVTDNEIEKQAKAFLTHGGGESSLKTITSSWLEKFKHKHGIGPGKLIRRASETAIPDSANLPTDSPVLSSASQTPGGISPASPTGQASPPAKEEVPGFIDFGSASYRHANSQSTTSLSSAMTDPASSNFSATIFSPTSQFAFSPDPDSAMFDSSRIPHENSNFQRPRSQTLPALDLEYPQSPEPVTPKYNTSATAPSSALESPAPEIVAPSFGLDTAISPPMLHHSRSNSSLGGRSTSTPIITSAVASSPGSPTQEDARRAADTLLAFLQQQQIVGTGFVNHEEFATLFSLTEKLKLHQSFKQIPTGLGGLSRIPEGDTEMSNNPTEMVKNESMIG